MIDRDYTLNRLRSRSISPQEFNYDILSAPPILSMFTVDDIKQLNYIATSTIYSAKLKEKYAAIDQIMKNRGFEKLVSGTNRVSYRPLFANNFIVKVAYDTVALKDSIREYKNQFLIKPFCTKVFEVTPCGTLGVFEKVIPVTNRKEYISMAADIYKLLSEFVIGKYIIDDIGTEYFNNIGFRPGFGAVILDFPYVYEVDGKKLYCNKPDYNDPTGYCNGPIDYDLGFNKLLCKKCGAIYKPYQLAKKIEYKTQIINESEEISMKITLSGGSKNKKEEIVTGDFRNPVHAIKSNIINKKVEKQLKEEEEAKKTVNGVAAPKEEVVVEVESSEKAEEDKEEPKEAIKAFSIDDDDKGKGDLGYEEDDDDKITKLLSEINNLYYYSDSTDEDRANIINACCNLLETIFADNLELTIKMFANILRKKRNIKDDIIKEFLDNNSCSVNNQFIKLLLSSGNYYLDSVIESCGVVDGNLEINITPSIFKTKTDKAVYSAETIKSELAKDIIMNALDINESEDEEEFDESAEAVGLDLADGVILSKKDLFPKEKNGKILVVKNDDGSYLTINDKIIAIDNIDDRKLDNITIVAKDWYENAVEKIESIKEAPVGSLPEEEIIEDEEASGEEE